MVSSTTTASSFSYIFLVMDSGRSAAAESSPERGPSRENVSAGLPGVFSEMLPEKSGICAFAHSAETRENMIAEIVFIRVTIMRSLNSAKEHKEKHFE